MRGGGGVVTAVAMVAPQNVTVFAGTAIDTTTVVFVVERALLLFIGCVKMKTASADKCNASAGRGFTFDRLEYGVSLFPLSLGYRQFFCGGCLLCRELSMPV